MTASDLKILDEIKRTETELKSVIMHFENLRDALQSNDREKAISAIYEIEQHVSPWNGKLMFDCPALPEAP